MFQLLGDTWQEPHEILVYDDSFSFCDLFRKHSAAQKRSIAIKSVLKGQAYVTPMIAGELMDDYRHSSQKSKCPEQNSHPGSAKCFGWSWRANLRVKSPICCAFHRGLSNTTSIKMIDKLNLKTSADLIGYAVKHSLL
jgi:hypothetical protein